MLKINKNNFDKWRLLLKVLSEEISETDPAFQRWLKEDTENKHLYQSLNEKEEKDSLFDKDKVFNEISDKLSLNTQNKSPFYLIKWIKFSSSIVAIILIAFSITYFAQQENTPPIKMEKTIFDPGSKKAYLLSQKGEKTDLSESFEIQQDNGTIISNKSEGSISFQNTKEIKKVNEIQTIYVPKGGEYELLLSDGTKVYLNSETELTFSSSFEGDTREVKLSGEAYFKVKKDTKPFIIQTSDLSIEVLGTSFNINAYNTNSSINTTLVEGSIKVHLPEKPEAILLKPENNLSLDKTSHEIVIKEVDTSIYTAWVKGEFVFRNQPLKDIFSQLERWYDFTISYEDHTIENMRFTGSAEKTRSLTYLLDKIKAVTDIKYKSEGDKIILYK